MASYSTTVAREWWTEAEKTLNKSDVLIVLFPEDERREMLNFLDAVNNFQIELMEAVSILESRGIAWKMWSVEVEGYVVEASPVNLFLVQKDGYPLRVSKREYNPWTTPAFD